VARKVTVLPGVVRETLAVGPSLLVVRFTFEAGAKVPPHRHPHEQSSYILKGRLRYRIGDRTVVLAPGDAAVIPGDVEHEAEALEAAVDLNSFTPVRADYLDADA